MSVESDVLAKIKPSKEECDTIVQTAKELVEVTKDYFAKKNVKIDDVIYVGSVAKGTFLKEPDIDLFILFPKDFDEEEMNRIGLQAGKDIVGGEEKYVEHPYTTGYFRDIEVDMVPCYHIEDTTNLLTAVDRTPFHTKYVLSKVDEKKCDEIRLLKQFMDGIGTYGAEPDTRGFSGYLCELLVIKFGSFVDVLINAAEWKKGEIITIEKKGPMIVAPLVVYDPVDPKRNVASAVHEDTMAEFIVASKAYLRAPSEKFFFPSERKPLELKAIRSMSKEHGSKLLTVVFDRPAKVNEDNLSSQIWKTEYALGKKLNSFNFTILRATHKMTKNNIVIVFELERDELSKTHVHIGPPVWVKNCDTFLSKWKDNVYGKPFIQDGHWTVIADRHYRTATQMLTGEAAIAGIGREIDPKSMVIKGNDETLEDEELAQVLTELLDHKPRWEN